jgi:predicted choloylglycine hydrolase
MYHPRLKGNHYDMGFHYGELLAKAGVSFEDTIKLSDEQMLFGIESLKVCEEIIPNICEEIKGLADGLQFPYERFACWLLTMYGFGDIHGCTCFCYNDNNKMFFGRNSDMFPALKATSESILYRPDKGYMFLGHSTSMVQMEDGMNEHGLAIGMNFLMTKYRKPGLNTGMIIRYILESCKTVQEAVDLIKTLPISSTQNFMMADKNGDMAVVECSPNKMVVRKLDDFLVSTNHFVDAIMQSEHANPDDNWYLSKDRYDTVQKALSDESLAKDGLYAQNILSGKMGFLCQYDKKLNFDTIWSVVYGLTDMNIFCAEGNPSKTKFKEDTRLRWGLSKRQ